MVVFIFFVFPRFIGYLPDLFWFNCIDVRWEEPNKFWEPKIFVKRWINSQPKKLREPTKNRGKLCMATKDQPEKTWIFNVFSCVNITSLFWHTVSNRSRSHRFIEQFLIIRLFSTYSIFRIHKHVYLFQVWNACIHVGISVGVKSAAWSFCIYKEQYRHSIMQHVNIVINISN